MVSGRQGEVATTRLDCSAVNAYKIKPKQEVDKQPDARPGEFKQFGTFRSCSSSLIIVVSKKFSWKFHNQSEADWKLLVLDLDLEAIICLKNLPVIEY